MIACVPRNYCAHTVCMPCAYRVHARRFEANTTKKVVQIEGKLQAQLTNISKKMAKLAQMANIKLEAAMMEANEKRDKVLAANRSKCEERVAEAEARQSEIADQAEEARRGVVASADATAVQAVRQRWSAYVKEKLFKGEAKDLKYEDVETALAAVTESVAACQRSSFAAKAATAQVGKPAADAVATGAVLADARKGAEAALARAEAENALKEAEVTTMREKAAAMEAEVTAAASNSSEVALSEPEQAVADAAAAKAAEALAKDAVTQAEERHALCEAEAAAELEKARTAAEAALALTKEQLDVAVEDERRQKVIQVASEEADVARAEAKSRRMMVEADRRKAEEARMATQHDAIGRRPGGKKVLLAAQRELLSQSNGRRPGSQSPKGRRSPIPTNAL